MKSKPCKHLEAGRITNGPRGSNTLFGNNGDFQIPSPSDRCRMLRVTASDRCGWDHVSVHVDLEVGPEGLFTPTWDDMCYVKDLLFKASETAWQYHPAKTDYVNKHPHVLHLWRCQTGEMKMPPKMMV